MELEFEKEKETKNTIRYQEVEKTGQPKVVGVLYVQKWFAQDCERLKVSIEKVE